LTDRHYIFDERFAESFLHASRHSVFGFKLKPFSYWHRLQLEWIDSKVLIGGATLWDIYLAAKICSSEYPHAAQLKELSSWKALWWHFRTFRKNATDELYRFYSYVADYNAPPKLWGGSGSADNKLAEAYSELARETGDKNFERRAQEVAYNAFLKESQDNQIDDTLIQVAMYSKVTGRPPREAWNMPSGELAWMNISFAKLDGAKIDVWTPMDEEQVQKHLIVRQQKIADLAKEMEVEHPEIPPDKSMYYAAVRYWQQVIEKNRQGSR
jgi:hypothetical protein